MTPGVPESLCRALAGRYELEREIGRGGMAVVYRARDGRHRRDIAIKVFREDVTRAVGAERFLREIEIAAALQHPHILTLIDSGEADGFLFYVMPFVAGGSLRMLLDRVGTLEPARIVELVQQIADALDYAHRRGLVHRDIKPENILLSEGHAVVADFGIAAAMSRASGPRMTRTGFPIGTPGYMSPEQAAGVVELGPRSDGFSLAVVAYEMAVGDVPGRWLTEEAVRLGRFLDAPPEHRRRLEQLPGGAEQALVRAMALAEPPRFDGPLAFAAAFGDAFGRRARYDPPTARAIVARAAELESRAPEETMTLGGVARIAAEVGIPPEHVERAAEELGAPAATPEKRSLVAGRTTGTSLERRIAGEVSPALYPSIVQEMAVTLGHPGLSSTLGRQLRWRMVGKEPFHRDVTVTITPAAGETRIQIDEKNDDIRDGWGLGIIGAVGAVGVIAAFGIAGSLQSLAAGAVGSVAWLAGCVMAARRGFRWHRRQRMAELESLAQRLVTHLQAAEPPAERPILPPAQQPRARTPV